MATKDTGIVNIHGKDYQTVAYRVNEFRKSHPAEQGWSILTEVLHADAEVVRMKALVVINNAVLATGHSEEYRASSKINKTSALENAETSAIGRALACFGMGGTEFASADEVAHAVSGNKEQAPKPLDVETVCEAMRNAESIEVLDKYYESAKRRATHDQLATIGAVYERLAATLKGQA